MAYKYTEYNELFRERAAESGFRYTFKELFSIIPSAIAHGVDTFFGLDGLGGDKDNYLHGPLGFLIGGPFALVGYLVGSILQMVFSLPSYLGRYLIDWPLNILFPNSDVIMLQQLTPISALLYTFPTNMPLPPAMRGLAGFIFGIVPELVRYTVSRLAATFVSLTRLITDNLCDVPRFIYGSIGRLFGKEDPELPEPENAPAPEQHSNENPDEDPAPAPDKKHRIKRAKDKDAELLQEDEVLKKIIDQRVNLFELLGVTQAGYESDPACVKKAYRKKGLELHPDRNPDKSEEARHKWDAVLAAYEILTNPDKVNVYLRHGNIGNAGLQSNRYAHFQPANGGPPGGVVMVAENDGNKPSADEEQKSNADQAPAKRRIIRRKP
ncbi:MAG: J domain-containing protein [Gammaproteobacteria bacterium]|nr:J domain-containing protein [Gammaproteobacteria bacterium]